MIAIRLGSELDNRRNYGYKCFIERRQINEEAVIYELPKIALYRHDKLQNKPY
jgi:hypothetical protein